MAKEELLKRVGRENPYRVPEHYFEDFTVRLMDSLPAVDAPVVTTVPLWRRVMPWASVAAVLTGAVFLIQSLSQGTVEVASLNITQEQALNLSDEEVEIAIDNSLLDGYDLYEYLTDASLF